MPAGRSIPTGRTPRIWLASISSQFTKGVFSQLPAIRAERILNAFDSPVGQSESEFQHLPIGLRFGFRDRLDTLMKRGHGNVTWTGRKLRSLPVNHTPLHHKTDMLKDADIPCWVPRNSDHVGEIAGLQRSDLPLPA